jgi:hypothetical protein
VHDETTDVDVRAAVADVEAALAPHRAGQYSNFVEKPTDASRFFAPEKWARLRAIKTRYDSGDLFAGNHQITRVRSQSSSTRSGRSATVRTSIRS